MSCQPWQDRQARKSVPGQLRQRQPEMAKAVVGAHFAISGCPSLLSESFADTFSRVMLVKP